MPPITEAKRQRIYKDLETRNALARQIAETGPQGLAAKYGHREHQVVFLWNKGFCGRIPEEQWAEIMQTKAEWRKVRHRQKFYTFKAIAVRHSVSVDSINRLYNEWLNRRAPQPARVSYQY